MVKSSFTVSYRFVNSSKRVVILGVTSIVPNLNGVLFRTENGEDHQVESHQMIYGRGCYSDLPNVHIEYSAEDDLQSYFEEAEVDHITLIDGRE